MVKGAAKKDKVETVPKKGSGKALSPYNTFMKNNVARVKAENPGITHKEAFKTVALMWATAKENPKNAGN
eukprot:CAMPEP_0184695268 /NCGR_PEP_ID=MMETSP0313-20130426/2965_1 /TAXON_ID=2792 /ORGANISM="Porphyridium aerugineum, Strain SAG 1380-2" /LENGTH=69 /DNA_ID=CAMNT_0027153699 /DNA_START=258 /DNA_END=467 /DNA_ORIENTATION=+